MQKKLEDKIKKIKENIKEIKDNENKEKNKLDNLSKKIEENQKFNSTPIFIIINVIFIIIIYLFYNLEPKKVNDKDNNLEKVNDIERNLESINKKVKDIDNNLVKVNNIERNLESINKKVNDVDNNFKSTNKNVSNLENNIKSINYKVNYIEDILEIKPFISYISIKDYNIFKNLMNEGIKKFFNKKIKKYNLLYLASTDGYDTKYFHEKCDGKSFTVTIVITKENKIFGGFTELEWDQSGEYKEGNKGFIFSITNNKIYYNKNYYYIYNKNDYGPSFKYNGFDIQSNYGHDWTKISSSYFDVSEEEYALAGELYFSIKDYAVYQIELE